MLTRSQARAMASKEAAARAARIAVVSSSSRSSKRPNTRSRTRFSKVDFTLSSDSALSISSDGSSSDDPMVVTPSSSFDVLASVPVTPQCSNRVLTTPPRISPKKLQRSPRGEWVADNGMARLVFVENSEEQVKLRDIENEIKFQRIEERELEVLLRERDISREKEGNFDMDVDTETSGTWQEQESSADVSEVSTQLDDGAMEARLGLAPAAYIRGDTVHPEDTLLAGRSIRKRALGPHGTELVDPVTFRPYSMESIEPTRIETWRQEVL